MIGMMLLGAGLPGLQFQAGLPIPGAETVSTAAPAVQTGSSSLSFPPLLQYGLAMGILLLFFAVITALLKKINLKWAGLLAAALALLFALFSLLPHLESGQVDPVPIDSVVPQTPSFEYAAAPIGKPPAGLLFWVAAGLLLASVVLTGWLAVRAFRRTPKEDPLAIEAEAAVQAIAGGQSLRDVIIRYYLKMEDVIARERGIERGEWVTPREFETHLLDKGIPRAPVLQLTSLFEKARYGNQNLNDKDEQEAMNCFFAIQKTCQPNRRGIR